MVNSGLEMKPQPFSLLNIAQNKEHNGGHNVEINIKIVVITTVQQKHMELVMHITIINTKSSC